MIELMECTGEERMPACRICVLSNQKDLTGYPNNNHQERATTESPPHNRTH